MQAPPDAVIWIFSIGSKSEDSEGCGRRRFSADFFRSNLPATMPAALSWSACTAAEVPMTAFRSVAAAAKFALAALLSPPAAAQASCSALLDHALRPLAGKTPESLCRHQGKVLLIVNVASKCGFTPQYEGLEAMHDRLAPRGFAVLGFPSNDFLGQEPGSEEQIQDFCRLTYGVTFPMYEKVHVKGKDTTPIYRQLREATGEKPGWNFHKYLVNRQGDVVASFGSRTRPDDPALLARIEALLAEPVPAEPSPAAH